MRRPRSIDVLGTGILVLSLGLWWGYTRTGATLPLLTFFAVTGLGIALEPINRHREQRRNRHTGRRHHPVMRGRRGENA